MLPRLLAAMLVAALLGGSLAACTDDEPVEQVEVNPTPINAFAAEQVRVGRVSFCSRVSDAAVIAAVGEVATTRHYGNGERATIVPGVRDVAHEYSCSFVGRGGDVARAWVFVPQVTPAQARALVRDVRRTPGCRLLPGHDFGSPGTGSVCTTRGRTEAAYRGLFVDAWLSCSVTDGGRRKLTRAELLQRTGDWCVQVATASSG